MNLILTPVTLGCTTHYALRTTHYALRTTHLIIPAEVCVYRNSGFNQAIIRQNNESKLNSRFLSQGLLISKFVVDLDKGKIQYTIFLRI